MDPNQGLADRPRSIRFFCNGDPFHLGQRVFVSRKRYPTLDRLLTDLSRKLNEVTTLPYGVRQIFMMDGGVRVNSIQKILDAGQMEFVCAGFETFRPIQYGQKNVERWRVGKCSITSLSSRVGSVQKNVKPRILSESNVNEIDSRNIRTETNKLEPVRSKLTSNSSEKMRKNSIVPSKNMTGDHRILQSTDEIDKPSNRPKNLGKMIRWNGNSRREFQLSKNFANSCKDLRHGSLNKEKTGLPNIVKSKEISAIISRRNVSPVQDAGHSQQVKLLKIQSIEVTTTQEAPISETESVIPEPSGHDRGQNKAHDGLSEEPVFVDSKFLSKTFEIGEVLGEGNFAAVKRCRVRSTDQEHAVKIIAKRKSKRKLKMLDNELKILRQCHHSNIVRLFDVYETKSEVYIIMELVGGGDLFDAIRCNRKFPESKASSMIEDLAKALAYLQRRNIVHRDVKPENILVQRNSSGSIECLKLADFGLAVTVTRQLFLLCGTPIYVAPEMLADSGYGLEVDLWSVGVILYILLSGYPPFRSTGSDDSELFASIQLGDFAFDSPHWDHVTEDAMDLVQGLLEVGVEKRLKASEVLSHIWILSKGSASFQRNSEHSSCHDDRIEISCDN